MVDHTNLHDPVLIRKHCETKKQARSIIDRYYNRSSYSVVSWKQAQEMDLRDYPHRSKRHHRQHLAKYEYPPDCISHWERQLYRNNERNKMKANKRLPKVTETAVWEIMDVKPILFVKRVSHYRDNHWAFSEPNEGLEIFKKQYEWPRDIRHLCNIVRVLREYYDIGFYSITEVAVFIYKKWGARIRKHCGGMKAIPRDYGKVAEEFRARGFVDKSTLNLDENTESWVESIHITPTLVHPEICWHSVNDRSLYDRNIYDFQSGMGIPGYTRAVVAGLSKRK